MFLCLRATRLPAIHPGWPPAPHLRRSLPRCPSPLGAESTSHTWTPELVRTRRRCSFYCYQLVLDHPRAVPIAELRLPASPHCPSRQPGSGRSHARVVPTGPTEPPLRHASRLQSVCIACSAWLPHQLLSVLGLSAVGLYPGFACCSALVFVLLLLPLDISQSTSPHTYSSCRWQCLACRPKRRRQTPTESARPLCATPSGISHSSLPAPVPKLGGLVKVTST
jgi:hypothetical protein